MISADSCVGTSSGFELKLPSTLDQWVCLEDHGGRRIWVVHVTETSFGWFLHCCFIHDCFSVDTIDMLVEGYKGLEIDDYGTALFEMLSLT